MCTKLILQIPNYEQITTWNILFVFCKQKNLLLKSFKESLFTHKTKNERTEHFMPRYILDTNNDQFGSLTIPISL